MCVCTYTFFSQTQNLLERSLSESMVRLVISICLTEETKKVQFPT